MARRQDSPKASKKKRMMQELLSRLLGDAEGLTQGESTALLLRAHQRPDDQRPPGLLQLDLTPSTTPTRVPSPPPPRTRVARHDDFQRAAPYVASAVRRPPQRVLDAEGNAYAVIDSEGRLMYLGDEAPPCLLDAGCCLMPCWCDVRCLLPLLYWCASRVCCARNEHFWFAMSRL
jgi:hypothetical protein